MSHFYGTLKGARGEATRCGHKSSGVVTHAAGWGGAIRTLVYYHEESGEDRYIVELVPWAMSGGSPAILAEGKLDSQPAD